LLEPRILIYEQDVFRDLRLLWLISSLLETGEPTVKTIISVNVSNPKRDPSSGQLLSVDRRRA